MRITTPRRFALALGVTLVTASTILLANHRDRPAFDSTTRVSATTYLAPSSNTYLAPSSNTYLAPPSDTYSNTYLAPPSDTYLAPSSDTYLAPRAPTPSSSHLDTAKAGESAHDRPDEAIAPPRQPHAPDGSGTWLRGRVMDAAGRPIDADVVLRSGDALIDTATDDDGHFARRLERQGTWSVAVESDGYDDWTRSLTVPATGTSVDVILTATATLTGWIDDHGARLIGLGVSVTSITDPRRTVGSKVATDGTFALRELPADRYTVAVHYRGHRGAPQEELDLAAGERRSLRLEAPRVGDLDLVARLPRGGQDLHTARLRLWPEGSGQELGEVFEIRSGQAVRLADLPAGHYRAALEIARLGEVPVRSVTVTPEQVATARFAWPDATLRGDVVGGEMLGSGNRPRALPVTVWRLEEQGNHGTRRGTLPVGRLMTDTEGHFALGGLAAGRYLVVTDSAGGAASAEAELADGDEAFVVLALDAGHDVEVRVRHAAGAAADVGVVAVRQPFADLSRSARTDGNGHARLGPLPAGTYTVRATWLAGEDGPLLASRRVLDVSAAMALTPVDLYLEP